MLTDVRGALLGDDPDATREQIQKFVSRFGLTSQDLKNLSISALMLKLIAQASEEDKGVLNRILTTVKQLGIADMKASKLGLSGK